MTVIYSILVVIAFIAWSLFLLLFGKHNMEKVQKLQELTNKEYAKLKAELIELKKGIQSK